MLLDEVKKLIEDTKKDEYGDLEKSFDTIKCFWDVYLATQRGTILTTTDVAIMMLLLKISRLITGGFKEDTIKDIYGYTYCLEKLINEENRSN